EVTMKKNSLRIWPACLGLFLITGCANVLTEMSEKDSDKAKLFDAQAAIDQGQWTTAITKISQMSTTYQTLREIQVLKASAYAGRCGLNILELLTAIQNGGSSTNLFATMMTSMTGATAQDLADCLQAETTLKAVSAIPSSDKKENLLMALTSLVKIGAILALRGDANGDGTLDWSRTGSFPCDPTTGTTALPVADVNEIGTGLFLFILSMGAFGSTGTTALDSLTSFCDTPPAGAPTGFCTMTSTSSYVGADGIAARNIIRRLVEQTTGVGLGLCTGDCLQGTLNECDNMD
ncbi:MAG: hypothetical protein K2X47_07440, partial [Bdellovibrionales bacterium]|nr:hypothetical protein [Bdellovibrionales bacterium]